MNHARITVIAALFALALPLAAAAQHHHRMHHDAEPAREAAQDPIFVAYEEARQALIEGALPSIGDAAADLGRAARDARERKLAALAAELEEADDLTGAREAFAAVSDEAIRYRKKATGVRPAVVWCSMEMKSWMQPGGEIENPYVDEPMRSCGELVDDVDAGDGGGHQHGRKESMLHNIHWIWMAIMLPIMLVMML